MRITCLAEGLQVAGSRGAEQIAELAPQFGFFWPALHHPVSKEHLWPRTEAHSSQLSYKDGSLKAYESVSYYKNMGRKLAGHSDGV